MEHEEPACGETHFCFPLEASRLCLTAMVVCCDPDQKQLGEKGLLTLHAHIKVLETGTEVEAVEGGAFLTGLFLFCSDYFLIVTSSWGATYNQST